MSLNQTGFRKGMETLDNIYVLNYIGNRQLDRRKGKLVALFVDLKAAFDTVDKGILETMRKRGIRKGLIRKVEEMLKEMRSKVRIEERIGEVFWTARGVRQECPISPLLFYTLLADMEDKMKKVRWEGIKLEDERIYSLAYSDVVSLAENEDEMRSLIERLEQYLNRKDFELNVEKPKIS